jgi:O-antigen/teichoic acid export membrane protein
MRFIAVNRLDRSPIPVPRWINGRFLRRILSIGILIWFAQLADYLYAPTDYLLIGHFLNAFAASIYAPAVQIDAGILILVTGLASVLLPRTALAHAADDAPAVRRYYVRGTLASLALLTTAALAVALLSPWIFRIWLGNSMPATRTILPLVLVNTVIGGSSAVGRSILLGIGRVKPFTISVLVAGATNVMVSWALVRFTKLGLVGIVLGTVVAVVGRSALWMPWYVMRSIRATDKSDQPISSSVHIV